ncbi:MAG: type II CAAX prenyl endopeptidase Rce1 family protein [Candidatus Nanopelagicales bacterium]
MSVTSGTLVPPSVPANSAFARLARLVGSARKLAVALLAIDVAIVLMVDLAVRTLAPSWALTSAAFLALLVLTLIVIVLMATSRLWVLAGVNVPSRWNSLYLLILPTLMVFAPVVAGFKPLSADSLLFLVRAHALAGLTEEAMWRGLVVGVLKPTGVWPTVLFGSVLFYGIYLLRSSRRVEADEIQVDVGHGFARATEGSTK